MEAAKTLSATVLVSFSAMLLLSLAYLPAFGSFENKEVASYYLRNGLLLTGSANIVNSIVWDFRGYDTMGEETVLFAAAMGVFLIIRRRRYGRDS